MLEKNGRRDPFAELLLPFLCVADTICQYVAARHSARNRGIHGTRDRIGQIGSQSERLVAEVLPEHGPSWQSLPYHGVILVGMTTRVVVPPDSQSVTRQRLLRGRLRPWMAAAEPPWTGILATLGAASDG